MSKVSPAVEMTVTELRRSATGGYEDTPVVFRFTGPEHSSAQGIIELYLKVNHVRKEIPGGAGKVVHQMMSATWQPFQLDGEWDDKWGNRRALQGLGFTRTGSYAMVMYQEFAAMVKRMPTVRLELDALSLVGVMTDLRIKYQQQGKIGWSVTMSPEDNENVQVSAPRPTISQPIEKWIQDAEVHGTALQDLLTAAKKMELKTPRANDLTTTLLEVNDALDRLQSFGPDNFESDTINKLLLLATTFRRLRGASLQLALAVSRVSAPLDVAYDDVILSMSHAEWIAQTHVTAMILVGLSRSAELDMKKRAGKKPRAIYRPKRGESLERISVKFYGTADAWRLIYDSNDLISLMLDGTEELIIPERRS